MLREDATGRQTPGDPEDTLAWLPGRQKPGVHIQQELMGIYTDEIVMPMMASDFLLRGGGMLLIKTQELGWGDGSVCKSTCYTSRP